MNTAPQMGQVAPVVQDVLHDVKCYLECLLALTGSSDNAPIHAHELAALFAYPLDKLNTIPNDAGFIGVSYYLTALRTLSNSDELFYIHSDHLFSIIDAALYQIRLKEACFLNADNDAEFNPADDVQDFHWTNEHGNEISVTCAPSQLPPDVQEKFGLAPADPDDTDPDNSELETAKAAPVPPRVSDQPLTKLIEIKAIQFDRTVAILAHQIDKVEKEARARAICALGGELLSPLVVKRAGYQDGMPCYRLISGKAELAAALRANELNPLIDCVQAVVVDSDAELKAVQDYWSSFKYVLNQ